MKQTYSKPLIAVIAMALISIWVVFAGLYSLNNEKRITFDGSLYDFLGSQLIADPLSYTAKPFWEKVKVAMPEGDEKDIAKWYLTAPLFKHPPVFSYCIALSKILFGDSIDASRYVNIFFRLGTVLVIFFLVKNIMGLWWGVFASFLISIDPAYTLCSQKIWMGVALSFFFYLGVWLIYVSRERTGYIIFSAIAFSAAVLCKYVSIVAVLPVYFFIILNDFLKRKDHLGAFIVTPVVVVMPWILWNIRVYGAGFLGTIISYNSDTVAGQGPTVDLMTGLLIMVFIVSGLLVLLSFLKYFKGDIYASVVKRPGAVKMAGSIKKISRYALIVFIGSLFALSWKGLLGAMDINYFPPTGASMHMYDKEPFYFYFLHLMRLSPVFIFSYLAYCIPALKTKEVKGVILAATSILVFFSFFGYYETRYIVMAMPALIVMAVFTIKAVYEYIKSRRLDTQQRVSLALFLFTVLYAVLKTVYFDLSVVVKNNFIFF